MTEAADLLQPPPPGLTRDNVIAKLLDHNELCELQILGGEDLGPYHCLVVESAPKQKDKCLLV